MRFSLLAVPAAALGMLAGCDGKTERVQQVGPEAREAISYAATAKYPGNARMAKEVQAAAIDYPGKNYLEIHNLGNTSIPPSTAWVNGAFLTQIEGIPPKSYVTVKHGTLLEAGPATNDLRELNQPIAKVELQTPEGLFSVQGPTLKQ